MLTFAFDTLTYLTKRHLATIIVTHLIHNNQLYEPRLNYNHNVENYVNNYLLDINVFFLLRSLIDWTLNDNQTLFSWPKMFHPHASAGQTRLSSVVSNHNKLNLSLRLLIIFAFYKSTNMNFQILPYGVSNKNNERQNINSFRSCYLKM